jgi:hypothetical protein
MGVGVGWIQLESSMKKRGTFGAAAKPVGLL